METATLCPICLRDPPAAGLRGACDKNCEQALIRREEREEQARLRLASLEVAAEID